MWCFSFQLHYQPCPYLSLRSLETMVVMSYWSWSRKRIVIWKSATQSYWNWSRKRISSIFEKSATQTKFWMVRTRIGRCHFCWHLFRCGLYLPQNNWGFFLRTHQIWRRRSVRHFIRSVIVIFFLRHFHFRQWLIILLCSSILLMHPINFSFFSFFFHQNMKTTLVRF